MQPNITLAANTWHDMYAVSGIAPGTPIIVCVIGNTIATAWEGPTAPSPSSWDGIPTPINDAAIYHQDGISGGWMKSGGPLTINVQVYSDD